MGLLYLLIFALCFVNIRLSKGGGFQDYLGKEQCNSIKGIFILMIFLSHSLQYFQGSGYGFSNVLDKLYPFVSAKIGQLVVVMFLFYSGYGVAESIKGKGKDYLFSFPRKRFFGTLLNFDVAVCCFIVMNLLLGIEMRSKKILLSLIAWESVGNSNWYIFVILFCYMATYIAFMFSNNDLKKGAMATLLFVLLGMTFLIFTKTSQSWWYNTILCFPAGVAYSVWKDRFEMFFQNHYLISLSFMLALFMVLHFIRIPSGHGLAYNFMSVVFALLIVLLTMKVRIGNKALFWFGSNLFPLYIYQRMPMIVIRHLAGDMFLCNYPYLYVVACFLMTCIIAWGYKYWQIKL